MDITVEPSANAVFELKLAAGNKREMVIGYNAATQTLYLDRSKTANNSFDSSYNKLGRFETTLALNNKQLQLRVFFDKSVVEVFANDGQAAMTMQLFPEENDKGIELVSNNGKSIVKKLVVWPIKSSW